MPANAKGAQYVDPNYGDAAAVTPSDTAVLVGVRGLLVTAIGQISVVTADNYAAQTAIGASEVVINLGATIPVGTVIPLRVAKVKAATAATVVALY